MKRVKVLSTGIVAGVLSLSLGLMGCWGQPKTDASKQDEASQEQTTDDTTTTEIDQSQTASDVEPDASVLVSNATGYDIASLSLRAAGAAEYDEAYTFDGIDLPDGGATTITFKQIMDGDEPVRAYDILLRTTDDSYMEMLNVDLLGLDDLTLKFDEGISYVEFTDSETNEVVDNKDESEQAIIDSTESTTTYDMGNQMDVPEEE